MSKEAEDTSKFALFPREGVEAGEAVRSKPDGESSLVGEQAAGGDGVVVSKGNGNLALGVVLTVVALILSGVAHRLAPVEARVSLVTGGVLVLGHYVMSSVRVLGRQNGFFLGLALAFLLVALVPVGMAVWQGAADYASRIRVADVAEARTLSSGAPPSSVPALNGANQGASVSVSEKVAPEKAESRGEVSSEKQSTVAVGGTVPPSSGGPSVAGSPEVSAQGVGPAPVEGKLSVEEREAKIAAMAEISAPVVKKATPLRVASPSGLPGEDVPLAAGGSGASGTSGLNPREFNERVLQSKLQVVQRYPALGRNGSDEVKVYTEVFNELVRRNRDFFLNPDWPLDLAELVAKREGWIPEEGSLRK